MSTILKKQRQGAIMVWTLDQPETRNALTGNNAAEEFVQACAEVAKDPSVRVVVLTGAGPVFSSGGNVKDMQKYQGNTIPTEVIRDEYRHGIQRIPKALYPLDVPVIAAVNGPAIGAGLDLTCMCDIRIASEKATFAESFVKVGIVPGDGGAWLLPNLIGIENALKVVVENPLKNNRMLKPAEAYELGMADVMLPPANFLEDSIRWADGVLSGLAVADLAFAALDPGVRVAWSAADGSASTSHSTSSTASSSHAHNWLR